MNRIAQTNKKLGINIVSTTYQCSATFIGVVRHAVNKSAGSSGNIGNNSFAQHAAICIQLRTGGMVGMETPCDNALYCGKKKIKNYLSS